MRKGRTPPTFGKAINFATRILHLQAHEKGMISNADGYAPFLTFLDPALFYFLKLPGTSQCRHYSVLQPIKDFLDCLKHLQTSIVYWLHAMIMIYSNNTVPYLTE